MNRQYLRVSAIFTILPIACCTPARACSPTDFVVKQADWQPASPSLPGMYKIVGEVTNNCDQAAGVELKFVFRDGVGKITRVVNGWPASFSNIPAHSDYAFELMVAGGEDVKTMQAYTIDTEKWQR